MLELIVGVVMLGILAAIAVPSYARVVKRSQDDAGEAELAAVSRDATATFIAAEAEGDWVTAVEAAVAEVVLTPPAAGETTFTSFLDDPAISTKGFSEAYGEVSYIFDDDRNYAAAMMTRAGSCAMILIGDGALEGLWTIRKALGANCRGGLAFAGEQPDDSYEFADPDTYGLPDAPTNVTALGGVTQATISWTASSSTDLSHYQIRRDGVDIGVQISKTEISYVDTGLAPATSYTYEVVAVDTTALSSAPGGPATALTAPATPQDLTATQTAPTVVTMTWTASPGTVAGYRMFIDGSQVWQGSGTTFTHTSSDTASPLTAGTTFHYQVASYNATAQSPTSDAVEITTTPAAPGAITTTPADKQVYVTWPEVPGSVSGYHVLRDNVVVGTITVGTTNFTDSGLTNGVTYTYTVRAYNSGGNGPESQPASATPYTVPAAPADLRATPGNTIVTLTWTPVVSGPAAPVTGYRVFMGGVQVYQGTNPAQTSHVVSALRNGTRYFFQMATYGDAGQGPMSPTVQATPGTRPGAPIGVVGSSPSPEQARVVFHPPFNDGGAAIFSYTVSCSSSTGGVARTVTRGAPPGSPATLTRLSGGHTYSCRVLATNWWGSSPYSAPSANFLVAPVYPYPYPSYYPYPGPYPYPYPNYYAYPYPYPRYYPFPYPYEAPSNSSGSPVTPVTPPPPPPDIYPYPAYYAYPYPANYQYPYPYPSYYAYPGPYRNYDYPGPYRDYGYPGPLPSPPIETCDQYNGDWMAMCG